MDVQYIDLSLTPKLKALAKELGVINGLPFSINDDFLYDPVINKFFSSLAMAQTASPRTWRTYSEQISIFFRFLEANNKDWLSVTKDDIGLYYRARRLTNSEHKLNKEPVSEGTWNLGISALIKLYEWAEEDGLIKRIPFTRKQAANTYMASSRKRRSSGIKEKEKRYAKPVKSLRLEEYKEQFIPAINEVSRNAQRDNCLANFLLTTGCRITEALSQDLFRLPDPYADKFAGLFAVPMKIRGKGNKERTIKIPKHVLKEINLYVREDRADIVDKWEKKNPKVKPASKKYPNKIFLSERGTPFSVNSAEKVFSKAAIACNRNVTPHMMRHTFAIYTLSSLIKQAVKDISEAKKMGASAYKKLLRDPLRSLQKLMGHSHIDTTYGYLDYLEEEEAFVDEALDIWTSDIYK